MNNIYRIFSCGVWILSHVCISSREFVIEMKSFLNLILSAEYISLLSKKKFILTSFFWCATDESNWRKVFYLSMHLMCTYYNNKASIWIRTNIINKLNARKQIFDVWIPPNHTGSTAYVFSVRCSPVIKHCIHCTTP